ncbi:MAG: DUF1801 domain-containing protein [Candidatus Pedobacter colombiensis]|uniref:DUF1801 domain-containing protein n=1 Tax=Candidatus Pedobacter colombiensis TaxID=3121371 RepID=A0AAJ6B8L6_9SPHI|nr:DUF1801 domain-containing protein [Pedobacter sp.]WEK21019.1 MAG: DUF1801 domain-containing protein [Pedobacter sp.]
MAKNKTTETNLNVRDFLEKVGEPLKRKDCYLISALMEKQTGFEPKMWGPSIVGFGSYHYKYASGHEGDAPLIGFSPRSTAIVLYMASDFEDKEELLKQLGKHKTGKGCIYVKKLEGINIPVLTKMIDYSVANIKKAFQDK